MPFNAKKLIFIDESGANLAMCRNYARAIGGDRIKMPKPFNRGSNFSIIGAIGFDKIIAALYGEWATDGEIFLTFINECLVPHLKPYHIVILDNISFHKIRDVQKAIEATGAKVEYLPGYSPDFSPIENMWSKIKTILRKISPRTSKQFKSAIAKSFKAITKNDLKAWYEYCGYQSTN